MQVPAPSAFDEILSFWYGRRDRERRACKTHIKHQIDLDSTKILAGEYISYLEHLSLFSRSCGTMRSGRL